MIGFIIGYVWVIIKNDYYELSIFILCLLLNYLNIY